MDTVEPIGAPFGIVYCAENPLRVVTIDFSAKEGIRAAWSLYNRKWFMPPDTIRLNAAAEDVVIDWLNSMQRMTRNPCERGKLQKIYDMGVVLEVKPDARG